MRRADLRSFFTNPDAKDGSCSDRLPPPEQCLNDPIPCRFSRRRCTRPTFCGGCGIYAPQHGSDALTEMVENWVTVMPARKDVSENFQGAAAFAADISWTPAMNTGVTLEAEVSLKANHN